MPRYLNQRGGPAAQPPRSDFRDLVDRPRPRTVFDELVDRPRFPDRPGQPSLPPRAGNQFDKLMRGGGSQTIGRIPPRLAGTLGRGPWGLAWDVAGTGFPDLSGDDTIPADDAIIVPWTEEVWRNQSNMAWPSGWTIVCM